MSINVDPKSEGDLFYRYIMPRVHTKVESGGNGVKTVMPNIEQVAQALDRDVEWLMKYLGYQLGSHVQMADTKYIIRGKLERERAQKMIFQFIEKFVLCSECRNPETVVQVDDKKNIFLECKACHYATPVDRTDKLSALIVKTLKPTVSVRDKKRKSEKSADQNEEEAFDQQARQAHDDDIIEDERDPVKELKEFIAQEGKTEDEIECKIEALKQDYRLNDRHVVSLVFEALFDENIGTQIKPRAKLLQRVVTEKAERDLIINLMCLCKEKESIKSKFPIYLKGFFDGHVLGQKAILEWHDKAKSSKVTEEDHAYFKERCNVTGFIQWLKDEDEEEESEED